MKKPEKVGLVSTLALGLLFGWGLTAGCSSPCHPSVYYEPPDYIFHKMPDTPWTTPQEVYDAGIKAGEDSYYKRWIRIEDAAAVERTEEAKAEAKRLGYTEGYEHGYRDGRAR